MALAFTLSHERRRLHLSVPYLRDAKGNKLWRQRSLWFIIHIRYQMHWDWETRIDLQPNQCLALPSIVPSRRTSTVLIKCPHLSFLPCVFFSLAPSHQPPPTFTLALADFHWFFHARWLLRRGKKELLFPLMILIEGDISWLYQEVKAKYVHFHRIFGYIFSKGLIYA